jgi:hypothetical protein
MLRLACLTSIYPAENKHHLPYELKLIKISTTSYFPSLSFINESTPVKYLRNEFVDRKCILKPKYTIVYLMMAHKGLDELKELYSVLHDEYAFFFFHIDSKRPQMESSLREWLINDPLVKLRCNHAVMPTPANILWGN